MVRNALKKIKEAGGEGGVLAAPTRTTTPKSGKGRKRKTDDDDDPADAGASPSKKAPKKSPGRPKKAKQEVDNGMGRSNHIHSVCD